MGGFGDAIKYLYSQFILRDVLSFITPGAIIVWTVLYRFFPELLDKNISWILYIPIFGLIFVIGFAVQCFGEIIGVIFTQDLAESSFKQRLGFFRCNWIKKTEHLQWWRKRYQATVRQLKILQDNNYEKREWARQSRERLVVLKQMCGNCFLAITLAAITLGISYCPVFWLKITLIIMLIAFPLLASLYWGHRVHVLRQIDLTDEIEKQLEK